MAIAALNVKERIVLASVLDINKVSFEELSVMEAGGAKGGKAIGKKSNILYDGKKKMIQSPMMLNTSKDGIYINESNDSNTKSYIMKLAFANKLDENEAPKVAKAFENLKAIDEKLLEQAVKDKWIKIQGMKMSTDYLKNIYYGCVEYRKQEQDDDIVILEDSAHLKLKFRVNRENEFVCKFQVIQNNEVSGEPMNMKVDDLLNLMKGRKSHVRVQFEPSIWVINNKFGITKVPRVMQIHLEDSVPRNTWLLEEEEEPQVSNESITSSEMNEIIEDLHKE
jgi:hypothetical protein